jgi:hypothetical protein
MNPQESGKAVEALPCCRTVVQRLDLGSHPVAVEIRPAASSAMPVVVVLALARRLRSPAVSVVGAEARPAVAPGHKLQASLHM